MRLDVERASIQERFEHILTVVCGDRFLKKQGLNNEVPFFICPYRPQEALEMDRVRRQLINRLEQLGVRVLEINLYDLTIEIQRKEGIWEQALDVEPQVSKIQFMEHLQGVLDTKTNLIPAIAEKMSDAEFDVLFLCGVGEVFPYIRSHNVLNNLQSTAKERPTLMFFPGIYTHSPESGASLDLFGRLRDDKYYRAFNIFEREA